MKKNLYRKVLRYAVLLSLFSLMRHSLPANAGDAAFHICVMTNANSQNGGELRGAMEMARLYGDVKDGGMVSHITYPNDFLNEIDAAIEKTSSLADNPLTKAVVVSQAVPGAAEAFRELKRRRPDSVGYSQTAGLAELGKRVVEDSAKIGDTDAPLERYEKFSQGVKWNGAFFTDAFTSKPIKNYFMIYQDTYILGKGYMGITNAVIPEKYMPISVSQ